MPQAELHPLCCDCDTCLNGSGGLRVAGAGAVVRTNLSAADYDRLQLERVQESARSERARRHLREKARVTRA